jgi:hypothetical protein
MKAWKLTKFSSYPVALLYFCFALIYWLPWKTSTTCKPDESKISWYSCNKIWHFKLNLQKTHGGTDFDICAEQAFFFTFSFLYF